MIGIFDRGRCRFPATTLDEIVVQRLTACNQAVMAVGWREGGRKVNVLPQRLQTPRRIPIQSWFAS